MSRVRTHPASSSRRSRSSRLGLSSIVLGRAVGRRREPDQRHRSPAARDVLAETALCLGRFFEVLIFVSGSTWRPRSYLSLAEKRERPIGCSGASRS